MSEFEKKVYAEGLIDGIEVMNGGEFYPKIIDRAYEYGLFMASNTDIHANTAWDYEGSKLGRNMMTKRLRQLRAQVRAVCVICCRWRTLAPLMQRGN